MNILRLIDDQGAIIREYESEHTWVVEYMSHGEYGAILCRANRMRIYPSQNLTIEIEASVNAMAQ